jgi:hypothetical protein
VLKTLLVIRMLRQTVDRYRQMLANKLKAWIVSYGIANAKLVLACVILVHMFHAMGFDIGSTNIVGYAVRGSSYFSMGALLFSIDINAIQILRDNRLFFWDLLTVAISRINYDAIHQYVFEGCNLELL